MASKSKPTMIQKSMYPKELVYPSSGGELQLEMIRAQWSMYNNSSTEEDGICDMDMTEAFTGNITLNIPVQSSVDKGKIVNVLSENSNRQQQRTNKQDSPKASNEVLNGELMRLCQDKNSVLPQRSFHMAKSLNSSNKELDVEHQLQQLMLERDLESVSFKENVACKENIIAKDISSRQLQQLVVERDLESVSFKENIACKENIIAKDISSRQLVVERENVVSSMDNLANKENDVSKRNKSVFHFTPSVNDDSSLASWHGSSLMATRLNFSVAESYYEEPSASSFMGHDVKRKNKTASSSSLKVAESFGVFEDPSQLCEDNNCQKDQSRDVYSSQRDLESFRVFEDPNISDSHNQPHLEDNIMGSLQQTTSKSRLDTNDASEKTDFSVFEDASISNSYNQPHPEKWQSNEMGPLRVLQQNTSKSRSSANDVSEKTDFSVFEDPSISYNQPHPEKWQSNEMGPLRILQQNTSKSRYDASEKTDFSVFEDASISYNQPHPEKWQSNEMGPLRILQQNTSKSRSSANDVSEKTDFSVFEDPSISYNQPHPEKWQSNEMGPLRILQQNTSKSRYDASEKTDFSVFEDASISYNQPHPEKWQSNEMGPLRILQQNTSKSRSSANDVSEKTDFSVFEDPSISNQPEDNRKPLNVLWRSNSKDASINEKAYRTEDELIIEKNPLPFKMSESSQCRSNSYQNHCVPREVPHSCVSDPIKKVLVPLPSPEESEVHVPGFTEFEIPYDKYEPTSTPTGKRMGFNMSVDLTMIHPADANSVTATTTTTTAQVMKHIPDDMSANQENQTLFRPLLCPPTNNPAGSLSIIGGSHVLLETIQEESRSNYTSSTSGSTTCTNGNGSKSTNSSRCSNISACNYNNEDEVMLELKKNGVVNDNGFVNAFTSETIDFMCQSIPITNTPVIEVSAPLSKLISGKNITIGGSTFTIIKKLATGGFAAIYEVVNSRRPMEIRKVLKVQKPSFIWECAVVEELHKRLKANDLLNMAPCFMKVDSVGIYNDASITVYDYYKYGSLLDLVNKYAAANPKNIIGEYLLMYYAIELLDIVETLHSCGIIHADIKPDNIMLRDIRPFTDLSKVRGHGVRLIDFGRAIDMQPFPKGSKFTGSNATDNFQCVQMIDNTPWTYQADLYCIASTIHVMMFKKYMETRKDPSCMYRITSRISRCHDDILWSWFYSTLLNWKSNDVSQRLDLSTLTKPLLDKLYSEDVNVSTINKEYDNVWYVLTK